MANVAKTGETKAVQPKKDTEKDMLKQQVAELKAQMDAMMQMLGATKQSAPAHKRKIRFVNLTVGKLLLQGSVLWEIDGQFKSRDFSEEEADKIVTNMGNTITGGYVYIADAQFVEERQMGALYEQLLSDEQLRKILSADASDVVEMYKMSNAVQKKIIVDTIIDKRSRGEYVDANVLMRLGELSGKNLVEIASLDG